MDIEVRFFETNYIVDVSGEIDLYNASRLKAAVSALFARKISALILNLDKVTYIDSSGIGSLLSTNASMTRLGLQFCVVRVPPPVKRVLELTRLVGLLPVMDTEAEALDAFSRAHSDIDQETEESQDDEPCPIGSQGSPTGREGKDIWETVQRAIDESRTLTITTFKYLPGERVHIDRILSAFLQAVGMSSLADDLSYCIHELGANAKKANTKRLYFVEQKLDVLDENDYATGMKGFKQAVVDNIDRYHERLRQNRLYVKFQFRTIPDGLKICVRNNAIPTPAEKARIDKKLAIARQFNTFAEAYSLTEDETEGAGLGIVMMLFMLRKLGLNQDDFGIQTLGGETLATLTLRGPHQSRSEVAPADGGLEEVIQ